MLARNQHLDEKNELTMCEFEKKKILRECLHMQTHAPIFFGGDVTLGESIVFALGFYVFFFSKLCDQVIVKTDWG